MIVRIPKENGIAFVRLFVIDDGREDAPARMPTERIHAKRMRLQITARVGAPSVIVSPRMRSRPGRIAWRGSMLVTASRALLFVASRPVAFLER
jgi:hypothetical protein